MMHSAPIDVKQPPRLFPGDAVGIVAPASPFDRNKFIKGITVIEEMGFTTVVEEGLFHRKGYLAGTDAHRSERLMAMFEDPAIKAIICARGGYGSLRLLSRLDYETIAGNPKVFIGSSDITALLNTFFVRCGLVTLHGPMIESLSTATEQTKQSLHDVLVDNPVLSIMPEEPRIIYEGRARGIIAGGNLTTLCHLLGTPFEPDFSGRIVLLEDVGESPYRIDRMLTQMRLAGYFEHIAGLLLGSFKGCGDKAELDGIFSDIFSKAGVPVLAGLTIGHDDPNLTVPIGLPASFDTTAGMVQYMQPPFI